MKKQDKTKFAIDECYLMMFSEYEDVVTAEEVASMLRLPKKRIYRMFRSGEIKSFKDGRDVRTAKLWVIEYVQRYGFIRQESFRKQRRVDGENYFRVTDLELKDGVYTIRQKAVDSGGSEVPAEYVPEWAGLTPEYSIGGCDIGTKESPMNSNNVIFNTHYYGRQVSGQGYAWCCSFVWDVFRLSNASKLFYDEKKTAYCPTVDAWGKSNNLVVDKNKGVLGDIILFDFNGNGQADHIGLIEKNNGNGTYLTIEGNTSISSNDNGGCVMRRTRSTKTILRIIRPKYDAPKTAPTTGEYEVKKFVNKSGKTLNIFADSNLKTKIGTLYSGSSCACIGEIDGKAIVRYKVSSSGAYKVGFTDYVKGVVG